MKKWRNSWALYSSGLLVAWAVVLTLVWRLDSSAELRDVILVFLGYFIGWLSATIKVTLIRRSQSS